LEASGGGSPSSSGGTSTGTKVGALVGGIVGGMLVGAAGELRWAGYGVWCGWSAHAALTAALLLLTFSTLPTDSTAVIGVSYRAYTRCAAGGSKASAGSSSGPLLEAGRASDTPRQSLPLYSSPLPAVPE
jgi:hypothetical protein